MDEVPQVLTVEEAGRLLRIGRTKAYAMAKQWRETGGQCGLPVFDLGDVLRVPLAKLEEVTGATFSELPQPLPDERIARERLKPPEPPKTEGQEPPDPPPAADRPVRAPRRRTGPNSDQLDLFPPSSKD